MIAITTTTILLATQLLQMTNNYASATTSPTIVQAGEATTPLAVYSPQTVEINAGESVTWTNPTKVAEPHTITFFLDNSTNSGIVAPLAVSNTTKFITIPPGSNNEPLLLPSDNKTGMNTIIAVNARNFNPTAIDSEGVVSFMKLNSNYSMTGTEKYVNSGWILPKGLEQQYPGSGNTFTVTFEKPGTYDYICVIHPWMTGSVRVR
ncbi:MAG TPA: plastocyanin/azurin family copper-binding protein [Nitrososphaeraceae archaeon]|nr:plastocyanin/azurin family copper-binding protein [Nitrososphaeraceae archaeon]